LEALVKAIVESIKVLEDLGVRSIDAFLEIDEARGDHILEVKDGAQGLGRMKRRRKGRGDRRSSGHGLLALLGAAAASEDGRFGRLAGSGSYRQWRLQKLRRRMLASTIASACGG
ncbi:hypothetical protein PanWU01x14_263770, partial [Parasponia andersonii]